MAQLSLRTDFIFFGMFIIHYLLVRSAVALFRLTERHTAEERIERGAGRLKVKCSAQNNKTTVFLVKKNTDFLLIGKGEKNESSWRHQTE